MSDILRFFTILLLIAIVLALLIPLAWFVIKLFLWLFGDIAFIFGDILLIVLIIVGAVLFFKWIFD